MLRPEKGAKLFLLANIVIFMSLIQKKYSKNIISHESPNDEFLSLADVRESWTGELSLRLEFSGKPGFRFPQIGAIYATLAHWTKSKDVATVVMPTGTGKTETMLALLIHEKCERLLVVVPTDPLREQIATKFMGLGLLQDVMKVLGKDAKKPVVGILKSQFKTKADAIEFIEKSNVLIGTAKILTSFEDEILEILIGNTSHVFIDEAHHAEARTWYDLRERFLGKKIIQFTATPYRNDGQRSKSEIIYNYPLRKAQEEDYFKPIEFLHLYEYDPKLADKAVADLAVKALLEDREKGYPHILLARVRAKSRADEVAKLYEAYEGLRVAKIYSGVKGKEALRNSVVEKEVDVVVCVDMLGEGFDLPELKIAAFHDIKKSLPTTIQFVGRFTRTKLDETLGNAKIVANLADIAVKGELEELYAQDKDWNELLPRLSSARTEEEIDFQKTIEGFGKIDDFILSPYDIRPAMSTVVYKNHLRGWNISDFEDDLRSRSKYELVKIITNEERKVLIAVTAEKVPQKWTSSTDVFDVLWTLTIVHWNEELNLLFIHSSNNKSLHDDVAGLIIGEPGAIINGDDNGAVFRCLGKLHRYRIQNVGLKELIGKLRRFRMSVGMDIAPTLSKAEIGNATKSHVFGLGYEFGNLTSLGCSHKGRIWSVLQNDINTYLKWCAHIGGKLLDDTIDPNEILRGAIVPRSVTARPGIYPNCVDWNTDMYKEMETHFKFAIGAEEYEFFNCNLVLVNPSDKGNIEFGLEYHDEIIATFTHEIFPIPAPREGNDFRIVQTTPDEPVTIRIGSQEKVLMDFFYDHTPEIWFADGSVLEGVALSEIKEIIDPFPAERILTWDWTGIDIGKEAQHVDPKVINSIQYRCIENLKVGDFDIIYDDDQSGEIADVVAIKKHEDHIAVELYHLKFAKEGRISGTITNLYELCGQTQKSIHWRFKEGHEFISHLLRRITKRKDGKECSRLEKGTEAELKDILGLAKSRLPFEFKVIVIQPAITPKNIETPASTLLAITENYVTTMGVGFEFVGSPHPA